MQHHVFDNKMAANKRMSRVENYRDGAKRWLDITVVLFVSPLALPLVGGMWLAARLEGGSGLFGHSRVGKNGTKFRCWKIRTMMPDAEAHLAAHLVMYPSAAKEWAKNYKLENDPRITGLGRLLRKTSLDELPQLWNVLRGDMSLVGPRPVPEKEMVEYAGYEWAYLMMRPGITGVWQVSGRNSISYNERVRLDVGYLLKASLRTDLLLLWRTIGVVLRRTGI